jgi:hypothetical protein
VNCATHASEPITGACKRCGNFVCERCLLGGGVRKREDDVLCAPCFERPPDTAAGRALATVLGASLTVGFGFFVIAALPVVAPLGLLSIGVRRLRRGSKNAEEP